MFTASDYLGIDISQTQISIACLKKNGSSMRLTRSDKAEIPSGAIRNHIIAEPRVLAKAIRSLIKKNRIRQRKAVVSLFAGAGLAQIIDLPEDMPANVGAYVNSQIKNSPLLARKQSHSDFCRLANAHAGSSGRLLVGATNSERINLLLKTVRLAGLEPVAVEFPTIAWCRSIYQNVIKPRFAQNVLTIHVRDDQVFFCVFYKHELDFIRCVELDRTDDIDYIAQCVTEVNSIIQYYELDASLESQAGWEIVINAGKGLISGGDLKSSLETEFEANIYTCSANSFKTDTPVDAGSADSASLTAIGLAMKYAQKSICNLDINLVPRRDQDISKLRDMGLRIGNIAAVTILGMILYSGFQVAQTNKTHLEMEQRRKDSPSADIEKLVSKHRFLNDHLAVLQERNDTLTANLKKTKCPSYAEVLDEIRNQAPQNLCITSLYCTAENELIIKGDSLDYQSVHFFSGLLQESAYFSSATLAETNKHENVKGLLSYRINCILNNPEEALQANAFE